MDYEHSLKPLKSESKIKNFEQIECIAKRLKDRAFLIGVLESVDFVVPFWEDTPYELIKLVQPNILVKGADYKGKEVVGSDSADEVVLIDFVAGKSTTHLIEKISGKKLC